ncbi:hypothetical protein G3I01_14680 [Gramella sp. MT6]|uniref:hypothetical protein n=1 Tax=Gramella sp. MT6 TaxID=2705471 RepID=UPI001C5D4131|nr:hypothetical protein [Gramella sp. MT6]QYA26688.1 hypothetical protein G3I01_14680 [Gramella sp. MT6]
MPKSRKRKIKKKKKKQQSRKKEYQPYEVVKQRFVKFENPVTENISFQERKEKLLEIANKASIEFEDEFKELLSFFRNYDALYLCSFAAYYFAKQEEGIDEEAINGYLDFPPFYLEILQCLALIQKRTINPKPLHENVENFKTLIQTVNQSQSARYFKLAENAKDEKDIGAIMLRTDMMVQTLAVRNWAYVQQMEEVSYELANLIKDDFKDEIGFNPISLLEILFGLVSLTERKINAHHKKIFSFVKEKSYDKVFTKYEEAFKDVQKTTSSERKTIWEKTGKNIKLLKASIMEHSDYNLQGVFTHDIHEIYEHFEGKFLEEEITQIMNSLCLKFQSLSEINKDHIFLNNPIHTKPFIKVSDNSYFSIIAHMFTHLGIEILETFISKNDKLREKYALRKGHFLENKVETLFRESFPNAKIYIGSQWECRKENKVFENDLIMVLEEFVIIVESKSGTVTPPAKRGAPKRLFRTMEDLVVDPSEQAIRFENYLKENVQINEFKTRSGEINTIDNTKVKYYVPLGITLSNLGSVGCNLKKLIKANIIPHSIDELAPSISYTDLEIIFEILTFQSEKIHYLSRRREFEAHLNFQGDEMDLFGFYLDNGFNIGETEYEGNMYFNLTLKSKELDPYFIGKYRGIKVKKPALEKSKYWVDLLSMIEKRAKNWLLAGYILLNLPKEDQIKYEKNLKELSTRLVQGKCPKKYNYMLMGVGPKRRQYVIAGFPYINTDRATRNALVNDIVNDIKKNNNIRGYIILGYDLDNYNYPYTMMAGSINTEFFDSLELD